MAWPARAANPLHGNVGSKAGLVTVAKVSQESRPPGKSVVRRQTEGEIC